MDTETQKDIVTFEPDQIKVLLDDNANEIIRDPQYYPITSALKTGPLTVPEITEQYNVIVKKECEAKNLSVEELKKRKRSEKTIYRYLKELEKVGLVTVAGQRVIIGQTATQKLWARTASIFIVKSHSTEWWESEEGLKYATKINQLTNLLYNDYPIKDSSAQEFLAQMNKIAEEEIQRLFLEYPEKANEIISDCNFEEMNVILSQMNMMVLLMKSKEIDELAKNIAK